MTTTPATMPPTAPPPVPPSPAGPTTKAPTPLRNPTPGSGPVDVWETPVLIQRNNFIHKSLSSWSLNPFVGCGHACRFCYVPQTSTVKLSAKLAEHGVADPDRQWGEYVLVRPWDEGKFLSSLRAAERTPQHKLNADGNRAVMLSTTTDPYQVISHGDPSRQQELNAHARAIVRRSLERIRDHSSLNVRILTRSPLARLDFDLFQTFGNRLLFGMSLPTLRNDLATVYEPSAPAPTQRLATLRAAAAAGIPVYVALAPTPPEVDAADLHATLTEVAKLNPLTIYAEPINVRAENVARIRQHAEQIGVEINTDVFASPAAWRRYAMDQLRTVEEVAAKVGLSARLHLWPDPSLGSKAAVAEMSDPVGHRAWLSHWWARISEWPRT